MIIWTFKEGEPLPLPECVGRKMRCGILSELLAQRGNKVVWWTSDFLHQTKKRLSATGKVKVKENLDLVLLHSRFVYKNTISVQRVLYSRSIGRRFFELAKTEGKPDVIYCSFPLVDLAYEATVYAVKNKIPIVIDVRDLWPDIIYDKFPRLFRCIGKALLYSMEKRTQYVFNNATRLTATVPFDLNWAQKKVGRKPINEDRVFYMGYEVPSIDETEKKKIEESIEEHNISSTDFIVCYFGNITNTIIDFETIIEAAKKLATQKYIKFVFCGTGVSFDSFLSKSKGLDNIILPGYVSPAYISVLMEKSSLGILPYYDRWDFTDAVPNKAIEYLAGGLPVLSQLSGHYGHIIENNKCGIVYKNASELERIILTYYHDKTKLSEESSNAYNLFLREFELRKVYGDYCEYIEELVKYTVGGCVCLKE